ncbi:chorismate synthase [Tuber brumale]|nr:chorismate synthase [Tuber brumale]
MSAFGLRSRVTPFALHSPYDESNCGSVGGTVAGIQLAHRRPALSALTTPNNETDSVHIQSGTEFGYSLGPPISLMVPNQDQRPHDYPEIHQYPRPCCSGHTYLLKSGVQASSGAGRRSAWEASPTVSSGAIPDRYLGFDYEIAFLAIIPGWLDHTSPQYIAFPWGLTREKVDTSPPARCRHTESINKIGSNSIGGPVTCVIKNVPIAISEQCFDMLEAKLAQALLAIPPLSGISNGENVYFKVAVKSLATIGIDKPTRKHETTCVLVAAEGRHEPCVVPSAVPTVEVIPDLVIMDAVLNQ